MAIIQECFEVPDDIMTRIFSGELKRHGGVVRYANGPHKGQIVKHLDPIEKADNNSDSLVEKVVGFAGEHKVGVGVAITIAIAAGTTGYIVWRIRNPKEIRCFRKALNEYIDSLKSGNLNLLVINSLLDSITNLKKRDDYENYKIALSAGDLVELVSKIHDYTTKLATRNSIKLSSKENNLPEDMISGLEQSLSTQKRIIELVA